MGMSIEEAHRILSNGLVNAPSEHEWCMAFKLAIDTMRKYQKIQKIMKSKKMDALNIGIFIPKDMACVLHEIKEVIEDGNDD